MVCELLQQVTAVPSRRPRSHVIKTSLTNPDARSGFICEHNSFCILFLTSINTIQRPLCVTVKCGDTVDHKNGRVDEACHAVVTLYSF